MEYNIVTAGINLLLLLDKKYKINKLKALMKHYFFIGLFIIDLPIGMELFVYCRKLMSKYRKNYFFIKSIIFFEES